MSIPSRPTKSIPAGYGWEDLHTLTGAELEKQYKVTLEKLAEQTGILGRIFAQATQ